MKSEHRPPAGFTLKELTVAMSLGSILMATAVGLLSQSMRIVNDMRHRADDDRTFFRLSQQWRNDAHIASDAVQDGNKIVFELDQDSSIEYVFDTTSIVRVKRKTDEVIHREPFRWQLPKSASLSLNPSSGNVVLEVSRRFPEVPDLKAPLWRRARAVVGLRLRHETGDVQ